MSNRNRHKKSGNQDDKILKGILLATAIINLIKSLLDLTINIISKFMD